MKDTNFVKTYTLHTGFEVRNKHLKGLQHFLNENINRHFATCTVFAARACCLTLHFEFETKKASGCVDFGALEDYACKLVRVHAQQSAYELGCVQ